VHREREAKGLRRRRWAVPVAGIAVSATVALLTAVPAGADRLPVPSPISIAGAKLGFHGRVLAPLPFCRGHRRVTLFKVVDGGPDQAMGQTGTDRQGHWSIAVSGFAGISLARFYATVRGAKGHFATLPYQCGRARSMTIKLGG
jgi:hypothetical protein